MLSRCHSLCGGAGPFWQFVPRKGVARHWHEYHGGSVECWQVPPFLHGCAVHPSSSHVAPLHPASPLQMHGSSELAGQVPPWPHVFDPQLAFPAEPSAESQRWADTKANASNARREHRIGPTNTDTRYRVPRRPKWGRWCMCRPEPNMFSLTGSLKSERHSQGGCSRCTLGTGELSSARGPAPSDELILPPTYTPTPIRPRARPLGPATRRWLRSVPAYCGSTRTAAPSTASHGSTEAATRSTRGDMQGSARPPSTRAHQDDFASAEMHRPTHP